MRVFRGFGIVISILMIVFIVLFNVNNVMYRTNNSHLTIFGYKLMTIDNKYDYYLVKESKINDIILYDNVSFRVNSTDLNSGLVKGKVNDCLKLTDDTVVCSNNLEGKVVMKMSGARDFLLANKGSLLLLIACAILLVLVFLWKPKPKKVEEKVVKNNDQKENDVTTTVVENKPVERKEVVVTTTPEVNNKDERTLDEKQEDFRDTMVDIIPEDVSLEESVAINETPEKEEIKTDVELPESSEIDMNNVSEVDSFKVDNSLEVAVDKPPVENVNVNQNNDVVSNLYRSLKAKEEAFAINKETDNVPFESSEVQEWAKEMEAANQNEEVVSLSKDVYDNQYTNVVSDSKEVYDKQYDDVIVVPKDAYDKNNDEVIVVPKVSSVEPDKKWDDVIVIPYTGPTNKELEDVMVVPLPPKKDDSLNDYISIPFDALMNYEREHREEKEETESKEYDEVISIPVTYSDDRYSEYDEVITVPVDKYNEVTGKADPKVVMTDANIKRSIEINLNDIKIDSTSEKINVTPIYSSDKSLNEDVEVL